MKHYIHSRIAAPNDPVPVVLVGLGGTGSQILSGLARIHMSLRALGHMGFDVHAVDGDAVSDANVGRQLFSPADVGRNKAECLVTRMNMFFGLDWKAYPVMATKSLELRDVRGNMPHTLITAVDSAAARKKIAKLKPAARYVRPQFIYWLDTGNTKDTGQVVLGTLTKEGVDQPTKGVTARTLPTVLDLYPDMARQDRKAVQGPSCSVAESLERQDLLINQWVATAACQILWRGLRRGYITEHGAFINLDTLTTRPLKVDPEAWARMGYNIPKEKGSKS